VLWSPPHAWWRATFRRSGTDSQASSHKLACGVDGSDHLVSLDTQQRCERSAASSIGDGRGDGIDVVLSGVANEPGGAIVGRLARAGLRAGPPTLPVELRRDEASFRPDVAGSRLATLATASGFKTMFRSVPASSQMPAARDRDRRLIVAFFLFEWLEGVPVTVIANLIALAIGVAGAWLWGRVGNRRIWSLRDPSKLVIFVAVDSREHVRKGNASYMRPATGIGQVRALAAIAPSLRLAYRKANLGKVLMSRSEIGTEAHSDVITLGGGKHNGTTREIMNALSKRYVLAAPTREEGLAWIPKDRTQPKLYEARAGGMDGDLDGQITRDYGVIVRAPNPWNSKATVILLFGASTTARPRLRPISSRSADGDAPSTSPHWSRST
jgi:hypothetical protein